jgi:lipopolysaccharide exporter
VNQVPADPTRPLARAVLRGAFWTYGSSVVVLGTQILYTAATSRLVPPAGFGAYATAQALASFVAYFTFTSLGSAVTRQNRQTDADRWAAVGIGVVGGAAGAALLWVGAPLWARLWASPSSIDVIRALCLTTLASPIAAVFVGLLRRDLRLRAAAIVECAGIIVGMVGGLVLVLRMHSPTALAVGLGIASVATAVFAWVAGVRLGRPALTWPAVRALLSFSGQVSGQNFVYYGVNTAPTWFVSRLGGAALVGQYSRGNLLVGLPLTQLAAGSTKVLYPAYAKLQDDTGRLRDAITDGLIVVSGLGCVLFAAIAGAGPVLVPVLLGPHWTAVTALLPAFAAAAVVNILFVVLANAFEAKAMLRASWRVQVVLVAAVVAGLLVARRSADIMLAAALVLVVTYALAHCCQVVIAHRSGLVDVRRLVAGYAAHLVVGVVVGSVLWTVASTTASVSLLVGALLTGGSGLALLGCLWWFRRLLPAFRCARARGLLDRRVEPINEPNSQLAAS